MKKAGLLSSMISLICLLMTGTGFAGIMARPADTICAVTGAPLKVNDATPFSKYNNDYYYFLSNSEKAQFDSNPFKFAKNMDTCQVCGKQERKTRGKSSFLDYSYNGKSYHFCTLIHCEEFQKDPGKYIRGGESYSTRPVGKYKAKSTVKAGLKDKKKDATEDVEVLTEEAPAVTPEKKPAILGTEKKLPEVKPPLAEVTNEKGVTAVEKKEPKNIQEIKPPVPAVTNEAVKTAAPAPAALSKPAAEKTKAPKKPVTMEFEDTIVEE